MYLNYNTLHLKNLLHFCRFITFYVQSLLIEVSKIALKSEIREVVTIYLCFQAILRRTRLTVITSRSEVVNAVWKKKKKFTKLVEEV